MTKATDRMFERMDRQYAKYGAEAFPFVLIGALKGRLELLAEKFPEVEADIADSERFLAELNDQ